MTDPTSHLPNPPDKQTWAALAFAAFCLFIAFTACKLIRTNIAVLGGSHVSQDVVFAIAIAATACLFLPASKSFRFAQTASAARSNNNAVETRIATSAAKDQAQITFGWGVFALLIFAFFAFIFMNDTAVGRTFFKLPLIIDKGALVVWRFITVNIFVFVIAEVLVLVWGLIVALARMMPGPAGQPVRALATFYCDVFRGLPAIVTLYLIGFGIPTSGLPDLFVPQIYSLFVDTSAMSAQDLKIATRIPVVWWCILAITLTYGAYVAEVYRAGIESIHWSQVSAARSLGLSYMQTMRYVIIPQAIRRIVAPLLNDFIGLQKDTALVQVLGVVDGFNQSRMIASNAFNLSAVTVVAILFVLITIPQARLVDWLMERDARRMKSGG